MTCCTAVLLCRLSPCLHACVAPAGAACDAGAPALHAACGVVHPNHPLGQSQKGMSCLGLSTLGLRLALQTPACVRRLPCPALSMPRACATHAFLIQPTPHNNTLQRLELSGSQLTGTVPPSWTALTGLDTRDLAIDLASRPAPGPSPTDGNSPPSAAAGGGGSSIGPAIGAAVGGAGAALLLLAGIIVWRRRKQRKAAEEAAAKAAGAGEAELTDISKRRTSVQLSSDGEEDGAGAPPPKPHEQSPVESVEAATTERAGVPFEGEGSMRVTASGIHMSIVDESRTPTKVKPAAEEALIMTDVPGTTDGASTSGEAVFLMGCFPGGA